MILKPEHLAANLTRMKALLERENLSDLSEAFRVIPKHDSGRCIYLLKI